MDRCNAKRGTKQEDLRCIFCNEKVADKVDTVFFCFPCVQYVPQNIVFRMCRAATWKQIRGEEPPSVEWETLAEMAEYCYKKAKEAGIKFRKLNIEGGVIK